MNGAMLVKVYGWFLVFILVSGTIFYVIEYLHRGGTPRDTFKGFLKLACFFPLALVVFLYVHQIQWLPRLFWKFYVIFIAGYLAATAILPRFSPMRENLKEKMRLLPLVGPLLIIFLIGLFIPAFFILCRYALR